MYQRKSPLGYDRELEFCVFRRGNNTTYDGFITNGEDYPSAFSLDDNSGIEGEIAGHRCIV